MRLPLGVATVVLVFAGFAWWASQRPEIRALFQSTPTPENPLEFLETLPEVRPPVAPPAEPDARRGEPSPAAGTDPDPTEPEPPPLEAVNQVANEEVARVLMQILAARNLAADISIAVTDREVAVYGEVASSAQRSRILEIIEGGREARRINIENLAVRADD